MKCFLVALKTQNFEKKQANCVIYKTKKSYLEHHRQGKECCGAGLGGCGWKGARM